MTCTVHQFPCLDDNYGFLLRDDATGMIAAIDTPDSTAILAELAKHHWQLTAILNTHWHPDHAGGNAALKAATGAHIYAPGEVRAHYPLDQEVAEGDAFWLGKSRIQTIGCGGHTLGHVAYYLSEGGMVFVGDVLFPLGCGRIFEGTPKQMWDSLSRLVQLPRETLVYCAHEYTLANAIFAESVDDSSHVAERIAAVRAARARGDWTVPTTIKAEIDTNPYLRALSLTIAAGASDDVEALAIMRAARDAFSHKLDRR